MMCGHNSFTRIRNCTEDITRNPEQISEVLKEDRRSARDGSAYAKLRRRGRGRDNEELVAGSLRVILMGDKGKVIWFLHATHDANVLATPLLFLGKTSKKT